ncbi:MAG TPA: DUF4339 domain-containing protein [Planctomycetaceae bacterium]
MAQQWYAQLDGRTVGPFPAKKLRDLASAGTLTPETPIRTDDGAWMRAARIKGLFEGVQAAAGSGIRTAQADRPSPDGAEETAEETAEWPSLTPSELQEDEFADMPALPPLLGRPASTSSQNDGGTPDYRFLRAYAVAFGVAAAAIAGFGAVTLLVSFLGFRSSVPAGLTAVGAGCVAFGTTILLAVVALVIREAILLAVNVATDVRRTRESHERLARP